MDEKKLKALAAELAKGLKTEADLNAFSRMLTKLTVETALNAELTDHLGHEKNAPKTGSNTRNGYSSKTVLCDDGEIELNTPRDRENTFEPQLIKKHQTRITQMDSQILSLYAKGMTTREIVATFKEMYDADVSPSLISKVTDAVKEQVTEWQNRQLDALYPIVYMDCIVVKVRQNGSVINKAVFLALGINTEGQKELLGMWLAENEGAKFWLSVLTELKNRGLQDILIACVDGLKGFPDAINSVFPQTHIQLCIIHMVRNSLKYVSWKDYKAVTSGLKAVYQAPTEEAALMALDAFAKVWDDKYPQISKSWRAHWENLNTLFSYPPDIRKAIYTTNAIESLNSVIRAAIKKRKVFPTDDSVRKVVYLAIKDASKKWSMPIQNWRLAMSRFIIEFGDRLSDHL
ncbi:IS256 family transposase, partial [Salmonella enterica subsp. enterica serovar Kua]|uniref:Mutator family transposase n=1 Tax=Salmonella enterica subsp. enterica serovar Tudu TaxID=2021402 RepID=A0A5H7D047_SALET|nr:IS256 family transposase [Salmonella enterica]EAB7075365.1 IS256 family transposase [Salmonella enterica subsp. enterica serovar Tudu]EBY3919927.1 IS256 family transposase [Salmonella enterica subsp. enterica serovar Agbeni]EIB9777801.1 IS256 family transposase [Salmonella enterica subsp. enterica serovar Kua]EBP2507611.1 IS256 family transposase [Salmonella enterica]ECD4161174.1 IS256 family transposase [Salmonella enterica subsp. enterica serovar Tudu]